MKQLNDYRSVCRRCQTVDLRKASEIIAQPLEATRQLWGPFWNEGEVSVFFSETNVGKSILAVQIAHDISRGCYSVLNEPMPPREVVYFDYELTDRQFRDRYSEAAFESGFIRATPFNDAIEVLNLNGAVNDIERCFEMGYKVVIIDNITFISDNINNSSKVLELMKRLKNRAAATGASLLLITHTPKRQPNKIITKSDASGSINILNFADSAFTIGRSYLKPELRYLKQIKVRAGEFRYTEENVLVGYFATIDGMLQFRPVTEQSEYSHIHP